MGVATGCFPGLLIRGLVFGLGLIAPEQGVPSASVMVHFGPLQFSRGFDKVSVFLFGTQILELANGQKPEWGGHALMMAPVASMFCPLHAYLPSQGHLRQRGWAARGT